MDNKVVCLLLGRKACTGMSIVKYTDNDEINNTFTRSANVYVVNDVQAVTKDTLLQNFLMLLLMKLA